jgi:hypothetical protein
MPPLSQTAPVFSPAPAPVAGPESATQSYSELEPPRAPAPPPARTVPPPRGRGHSRSASRAPALSLEYAEDDEAVVSALIDSFLDAAEDGQARTSDGRPYNDEELAQLEWALVGYVESHIGDLAVRSVRGRHVFRLIDELDDAGMPRPQLVSVIEATRELFTYAADRDLVRVNPVKYVSVPSDEHKPLQRLPETNETREARVHSHTGPFENVVSEQTIWLLVKIVVLVFICIALVLVAESF